MYQEQEIKQETYKPGIPMYDWQEIREDRPYKVIINGLEVPPGKEYSELEIKVMPGTGYKENYDSYGRPKRPDTRREVKKSTSQKVKETLKKLGPFYKE